MLQLRGNPIRLCHLLGRLELVHWLRWLFKGLVEITIKLRRWRKWQLGLINWYRNLSWLNSNTIHHVQDIRLKQSRILHSVLLIMESVIPHFPLKSLLVDLESVIVQFSNHSYLTSCVAGSLWDVCDSDRVRPVWGDLQRRNPGHILKLTTISFPLNFVSSGSATNFSFSEFFFQVEQAKKQGPFRPRKPRLALLAEVESLHWRQSFQSVPPLSF